MSFNIFLLNHSNTCNIVFIYNVYIFLKDRPQVSHVEQEISTKHISNLTNVMLHFFG